MDIHELVGAYALGAVSEEEAREFEAHLTGCEPCQAELAGYAAVVEELAEPGAAEPADADVAGALPAGFHDSVMARIAQTEQVVSPTADAGARLSEESSGSGGAAGGGPAGGGASVTSIESRRRWLPRLVAAAAVVLAVAGIGVGYSVLGDNSTDTVAADVERIQLASDVVVAPLGLGDATAYVSPTEGLAVTGDTPELPEGQQYQMWIVPADGSAPIPGPTMDGGEANAAWVTSLLADAAGVAVSIEPDGGSQTPTEVVISVNL